MAGAILAARLQRVPVVIDGYVSTAAAALLHAAGVTRLVHAGAAADPGGRLAAEQRGVDRGRDRGVDQAGHARKVAAVEAALACHQGHLDDPLAVMALVRRRRARRCPPPPPPCRTPSWRRRPSRSSPARW
jgi:NaMN:DMB phosphoribosyltransferase